MRTERRLISGGILGFVGYLLSPLSWWNDLYVNIPVAYVGGWLASLVCKGAFMPVFLVTYWMTNISGFVLMHKGICQIGGKKCGVGSYTKKDLAKDVAWTLAYTVLMVLLVKLKVVHIFEGHLFPTLAT